MKKKTGLILILTIIVFTCFSMTVLTSEPPSNLDPQHNCQDDNNYDTFEAVDSTCTTPGHVKYHRCRTCGRMYNGDFTAEFTDMSQIELPLAGHQEGQPAQENLVDATCTESGHYDLVTRCTSCGELLRSERVEIPPKGHTPGEWTTIDFVPPTCTRAGMRTLAQFCTVCSQKVSEKDRQEPVEPSASYHVLEQVPEKPATCAAPGNIEYYVCSECGAWVLKDMAPVADHNSVIIPATGNHTPEQVTENETAATCQAEGSYDLVTRCSVCGAELGRETVPVPKAEHVAGAPAQENVQPATCQAEGSYDLVTRCSVCGAELGRETVPVPKAEHVAAAPAQENVQPAACLAGGSYDLVTRCSVCGAVLHAESILTDPLGHMPGEEVKEKYTEPTQKTAGGYEAVVYCSRCDLELSRTKVILPQLQTTYTSFSAAEEAARAAEEAARAAAEAARQAAEIAARTAAGNIPIEPATTAPVEQPTRPAPAPVPVPAPQRPASPNVPGGIPNRPSAVNHELKRITDVDSFLDNLETELSNAGKTLASDVDTLRKVLNGVRVGETSVGMMEVKEAVTLLGENITVYRSSGKKIEDPDVVLSTYDFLTSFEQIILQNKQPVDRYGEPQPFEIRIDPVVSLADMIKEEDIENTMMMVYNPESGEIAMIRMDAQCLDISKNPPSLKVTLPFPGLYTFIRRQPL